MVRMRFNVGKTMVADDGSKTLYHPDCVYQIDDDLVEELKIGKPPTAWPCDDECPEEWPIPPAPIEQEPEHVVEDSFPVIAQLAEEELQDGYVEAETDGEPEELIDG